MRFILRSFSSRLILNLFADLLLATRIKDAINIKDMVNAANAGNIAAGAPVDEECLAGPVARACAGSTITGTLYEELYPAEERYMARVNVPIVDPVDMPKRRVASWFGDAA